MKIWKLNVIVAVLLLPVSHVIAFAQTQAGTNNEACFESTKADGELNTMYQQVLREYKADALFMRKMRAAQRAWIMYRDAHLAALYPAADPRREYGSVYPACRCTALAEVTRKRTEELRQWTGGRAEGDVCAGSTRARTAASTTEASDVTQTASVTGTVTYLQRIALTPNAVVEVKLLDVSRADAPAVTIAEQVIRAAGRQVPIEFELRYDPRRIDDRHRYAVQARILEDGKLWFINTQAFPAITAGNPNTVEVVVSPVR